MAFICAILMSFTTVKADGEQAKDYVHLGGDSWKAINQVQCQGPNETCQVRFGEGGSVYDVYDEMNLNTLKLGGPREPIIVNP